MTIIKSIEVDTTTNKKMAADLQKKISKIEKKENAHFVSFLSIGSGTRINHEAIGPFDLEINTTIFMVALANATNS